RQLCPLLPECAASIGDVQVRNKGTIGGSLAHADPAADWPAAALALRAELVAASARGERVIAADDFFVDMLTTALRPDEVLREIRINKPPARRRRRRSQRRHLRLRRLPPPPRRSLHAQGHRGCGRKDLSVQQPAVSFQLLSSATIEHDWKTCSSPGVDKLKADR